MTQAYLERIGRKWQRLLGLDEWRIRYIGTPDGVLNVDGHLANCVAHSDTLNAKVRVATDYPEADCDSAVCHETLHVMTAELMDAAKSVLPIMSAEAQALLSSRLDDAEERLVRRLERTLLKLTGGRG